MIRVLRRFASSKLYKSGQQALADVKDGSSFCVPGFGIVGMPENSLRIVYEKGVKDLTLFTNSVGLSDLGHGKLINAERVNQVYVSFLGFYHDLEKRYLSGKSEVIPIPQGSLVEKMRAGKAGIPAFYTRTSEGTWIAEGKFPTKLNSKGKPEKFSTKKEVREFDGTKYVLEEAIKADFTLIKAYVGDKYGNLRFRKVSRNFNPDIAGCSKVTVAEVEHLVDRLEPDQVHLPGAFVDRVYQGEWFTRKIERLRLREMEAKKPDDPEEKDYLKIARRIAKEFKSGMYINLGVGVPGEAPRFVPKDIDLNFQVENGIIGAGDLPDLHEIDQDIINAGKMAITAEPGHSYVSSTEAFGIMRGHHLHMTVLGGMEVSQNGDLANYFIPGKMYRGVGGAMDLVTGCDYVLVGMEHIHGKRSKVVEKCNLPLTAAGCVNKLITQHAVFEFRKEEPKMVLVELTPEMTLEELKKITPANYAISPNLKPYQI